MPRRDLLKLLGVILLCTQTTGGWAEQLVVKPGNPKFYSLNKIEEKFFGPSRAACYYSAPSRRTVFIKVARSDAQDGRIARKPLRRGELRRSLAKATTANTNSPSRLKRIQIRLYKKLIANFIDCKSWPGPSAAPSPEAPTATATPETSETPEGGVAEEGTATPTASPTASPTVIETPTPVIPPVNTPTPTRTNTPAPTNTATRTPTPPHTPTNTPTLTPTPFFTATRTATATPTRTPTQTPTATATSSGVGTTASSITDGGITWTFSSPRPVGRYVDGSYWVVGPVTITSISPAFNGSGNGSMLDPRPVPAPDGIVYSGYDTRDNYNPTLTVQTPLFFQNDGQIRSLVSTISNLTGGPLPDPYGQSNYSYLREIRILTIEPSVPPNDSFRPNYLGLTKARFRLSDMNLAQFNRGLDPNRYPAQIPAPSMIERIVDGGAFGALSGNWGDRYIRPSLISPDYGQYFARLTGDLALYVLHVNVPYREQVLRKLIQYGIDVVGAIWEAPAFYRRDGGQTNGHKIPVFMLAHSLFPGALKSSLMAILSTHPFSENGQIANAVPYYTPNTGYSFAGFETTGAIEALHPSTYNAGQFHGVRYKYCCTLTVFSAPWLVVSLLNAWDTWGSNRFREYVWGYYEIEDLNAQATTLDYYSGVLNQSLSSNQQISSVGNWFINPQTGHGVHYSEFARQVWSFEAASLAP